MPKRTISIRLSDSTLKDIESLGDRLYIGKDPYNSPNRTEIIKFLIYKGFRSLGNWREKSRIEK